MHCKGKYDEDMSDNKGFWDKLVTICLVTWIKIHGTKNNKTFTYQ